MPTICALFSNELLHKLRQRAIEAGVTQRALIPQLVAESLQAAAGMEQPVAGETAAEAAPAKLKTDESERVIQLGPDPERRNAICGLCGARYKPSGITAHIRHSHPEVE